ncbi:MAG TPA: ribosomal oxygenase, partial [Moraxella sp.]|nr:ribosomal oxygenase [Moraxella sp.]
MTQHFCLPSDISPEQFLSEYWQKKPLLIKQGLPQLVGMFEPDDIIGLAQDEDATARLISENNQQWSLKTSPLTAKDFQKLPKHWTVLVQNMEQWSPALGNLWHAFDFIAQWQRDDIMVSYAPSGGSVGKHYDNYDVFLAQGYGKRHWQLGKYCDQTTQFEAGQPIRLMNEMGELIFDEVLEP